MYKDPDAGIGALSSHETVMVSFPAPPHTSRLVPSWLSPPAEMVRP